MATEEKEKPKGEGGGKCSVPLYLVLPSPNDLEEEFFSAPSPYPRAGQEEGEGRGRGIGVGGGSAIGKEEGLRNPSHTGTGAQREEPLAKADPMAFPLHAAGPPEVNGKYQLVHWPFATSDLYN